MRNVLFPGRGGAHSSHDMRLRGGTADKAGRRGRPFVNHAQGRFRRRGRRPGARITPPGVGGPALATGPQRGDATRSDAPCPVSWAGARRAGRRLEGSRARPVGAPPELRPVPAPSGARHVSLLGRVPPPQGATRVAPECPARPRHLRHMSLPEDAPRAPAPSRATRVASWMPTHPPAACDTCRFRARRSCSLAALRKKERFGDCARHTRAPRPCSCDTPRETRVAPSGWPRAPLSQHATRVARARCPARPRPSDARHVSLLGARHVPPRHTRHVSLLEGVARLPCRVRHVSLVGDGVPATRRRRGGSKSTGARRSCVPLARRGRRVRPLSPPLSRSQKNQPPCRTPNV